MEVDPQRWSIFLVDRDQRSIATPVLGYWKIFILTKSGSFNLGPALEIWTYVYDF